MDGLKRLTSFLDDVRLIRVDQHKGDVEDEDSAQSHV